MHTGVIEPDSPLLFTWTLPGVNRRFTLRRDALGFILMWLILRFNDTVERLDPPGNEAVDEGGYNHRHIANSSSWSLHSYGQAADLNWNRHPSGVATQKTFTRKQIRAVHTNLRIVNTVAGAKVAEWGGDWPSNPESHALTDSMHEQVNPGFHPSVYRRVALVLARTPRGKKIIAANPANHDYTKVL